MTSTDLGNLVTVSERCRYVAYDRFVAATDVLADGFQRVQKLVTDAVDGLSEEQLTFRPAGTGNSIAWLIWHLSRVQDDHICAVAGFEQRWLSDGWVQRFDLPFEPTAIGYGHTPDEVSAVVVSSPDLLIGYHDAVSARTASYLASLAVDPQGDAALDRIVDSNYDPPVTLGVRLVSVLSDDLQHVGQAAYVRGLLP